MKLPTLCLFLTLELVIGKSSNEKPSNYKCETTHGSDIVILPRNDIYGRVNETLEATCKIDPKINITVANLVFTKIDKMENNSETLQTTENRTLLMKIFETEPSKFSIVCSDLTKNWCVREVSIGHEPLDVENFHCVSFNLKKLQCAYDLQENPVQRPTDEYYLSYYDGSERVLGHKCKWEECCSLKGDECWEWGVTTVNYDRDSQFLNFTLYSENEFGKMIFKYSVNQYEKMIPDPVVEGYTIQPIGPHKMSIRFRIPYPLESFKPGILYRIQYETSGIERTLLRRASGQKTIKEVIELDWPGQNYTVSISLRSGSNFWKAGDQEDQWWSTSSTKLVAMPSVRPGKLPEITPGSFRVVDMGSKNMRTIIIFWTRLKKIFQGGRDFSYEVDVYADKKRLAAKPTLITESYAQFENMSADTCYEFHITPKNIIGSAKSSAVIQVEKKKQLPIEATFPLAIFYPEKRTFSLRWFSKEKNGTKFTLFWCQEDHVYDFDRNRHCMGKLSWVIFENNTREANLTESQLGLDNSTKNLRFAVSTRKYSQHQNISGGMVWAQFPPGNYSPANSVVAPSLQVKDKTSSSAELEWTIICQHWRGNPSKFEIFWCEGIHNSTSHCTGLKNAYQVLGESTLKLTNLRPKQTYTAWVRVIFNGWYSELSSAVYFSTAKPVLQPKTIIWLSFGTVVVTLAAIFLAFYCNKGLWDFWRKAAHKIMIPPGLDGPPLKPEESIINSKEKPREINVTRIGENKNEGLKLLPKRPEYPDCVDLKATKQKSYQSQDISCSAVPKHAYISAVSVENIPLLSNHRPASNNHYISAPLLRPEKIWSAQPPPELISTPLPMSKELRSSKEPTDAYLRAVSLENIPFFNHRSGNDNQYISTQLPKPEQICSAQPIFTSIPMSEELPTRAYLRDIPVSLENIQILNVNRSGNDSGNYVSIPQFLPEHLTAPVSKHTNTKDNNDEKGLQKKTIVKSPYTDFRMINSLFIENDKILDRAHSSSFNEKEKHYSSTKELPGPRNNPVSDGYVQLVSVNGTEK